MSRLLLATIVASLLATMPLASNAQEDSTPTPAPSPTIRAVTYVSVPYENKVGHVIVFDLSPSLPHLRPLFPNVASDIPVSFSNGQKERRISIFVWDEEEKELKPIGILFVSLLSDGKSDFHFLLWKLSDKIVVV